MGDNGSRQHVALHAGCRPKAVSRVETGANAHDGAGEDFDAVILWAVHDTYPATPDKRYKTQEVGRGPTKPVAQRRREQDSRHTRFPSESEVAAAPVAGD